MWYVVLKRRLVKIFKTSIGEWCVTSHGHINFAAGENNMMKIAEASVKNQHISKSPWGIRQYNHWNFQRRWRLCPSSISFEQSLKSLRLEWSENVELFTSFVEYNDFSLFSIHFQMPHFSISIKFVKASLETTGRLRHQNKVVSQHQTVQLRIVRSDGCTIIVKNVREVSKEKIE